MYDHYLSSWWTKIVWSWRCIETKVWRRSRYLETPNWSTVKGSWWKCANIVDPKKKVLRHSQKMRTIMKGLLSGDILLDRCQYLHCFVFFVMGMANLDGPRNMRWAKPYADGYIIYHISIPSTYYSPATLIIIYHIYIYIYTYVRILYIYCVYMSCMYMQIT